MTQPYSPLLAQQLDGEPTAPIHPVSILIVDDEKPLRLVLRRAMEKEGYRTIDAGSAESCLFLCHQQLPDLILLDALMPGMDGFECCSCLKAEFDDRCPPILMTTALYDQESVDKAFGVGATDFVTKPIHWALLRQRVQQLLKASRMVVQWQASLQREQSLAHQLAAAYQRIEYLTDLCKANQIGV